MSRSTFALVNMRRIYKSELFGLYLKLGSGRTRGIREVANAYDNDKVMLLQEALELRTHPL